jgi:type IV secretory pathway VirJ component
VSLNALPRLARIAGALLSLGAAGTTARAQTAETARPADLPLVEVPASTSNGGGVLTVLITGDGNWAALVRGVARTLADHGVGVVGLEARSYLSHPRTPEETTRDVERIARYYMRSWKRDTLVLAGYSRGADFMPFVAARLAPDLRAHLAFVALFSPSRDASFEFHLVDLLKDVSRPTDRPTLPELQRLRGVPVLCVYGDEENDSLCPLAPPGLTRVVQRPGGHRTRDAEPLSTAFLDELRDVRTGVTSPPPL